MLHRKLETETEKERTGERDIQQQSQKERQREPQRFFLALSGSLRLSLEEIGSFWFSLALSISSDLLTKT